MPEANVQEEVVDDRRSAIEAAFDAAESESPPVEKSSPAPSDEGDSSPSAAPSRAESEPSATTPAPTSETIPESSDGEERLSVEKPPQSWRGPQKAKWASLDPDIRQEVVRRERDTSRILGESANARQLAANFYEAIRPFSARLVAANADPIQAVHELLKADHILTSAPKAQRAQFMAKLISDYDIDITSLDQALAGKVPQNDPNSQLEMLLEQRLAPIQQFLTAQQQQEEWRNQETRQVLSNTVESMANNPSFPHFQEVRDDMADVIEIQSKKGVYLTLEQAYNRAIAMNPDVNQQVTAQRDAEAKRTAALDANSRAQRALRASASVGGAPGGVPNGSSVAPDRRATIAAAFEASSSR